MLVLFRPHNCPYCDEVEELLEALVLAHQVKVIEDGTGADGLPHGTPLPTLKEGTHLYRGEPAIKVYLSDLRREVLQGRQFQSDACYLDPERPGECL
jgi:hypothetical protein